jgi:DNA-binding response OmpR family regulator
LPNIYFLMLANSKDMENQKKTILVVEDELPLLEAVCEKFIKEGFNVLKARDGREAVATAVAEHPDLIMMDIIMSGMDGMTAMKKIREDEWGKHAKIILVTNLSDSDYVNEAAKYGVNDFIVKTDYKLDEIVAIIRKKIE